MSAVQLHEGEQWGIKRGRVHGVLQEQKKFAGEAWMTRIGVVLLVRVLIAIIGMRVRLKRIARCLYRSMINNWHTCRGKVPETTVTGSEVRHLYRPGRLAGI